MGRNTATKTAYIKVSKPIEQPSANFYFYPSSSYNVPCTVDFIDSSTGNPASWKWRFGDGGTSTKQYPVHTYYKAGTYTISLTVKNAAGENVYENYHCLTVKEKAAKHWWNFW